MPKCDRSSYDLPISVLCGFKGNPNDQYHLNVGIVQRSKGESVVTQAAYNSGSSLMDFKYNKLRKFDEKLGVKCSVILAPVNTPAWVFCREKLWNNAEFFEKRNDGQVARKIRIALPIGLSFLEQKNATEEFIKKCFVNYGYVTDYSIHHDKIGNPHAHILVSMRKIGHNGFFGKKDRKLNDKSTLIFWRESWAKTANDFLCRSGSSVRIDHRSYKERGIVRKPTRHLGPRVSYALRSGNVLSVVRENITIKMNNINSWFYCEDYYGKKSDKLNTDPLKTNLCFDVFSQLKDLFKKKGSDHISDISSVSDINKKRNLIQ